MASAAKWYALFPELGTPCDVIELRSQPDPDAILDLDGSGLSSFFSSTLRLLCQGCCKLRWALLL